MTTEITVTAGAGKVTAEVLSVATGSVVRSEDIPAGEARLFFAWSEESLCLTAADGGVAIVNTLQEYRPVHVSGGGYDEVVPPCALRAIDLPTGETVAFVEVED